MDWSPLVAVTAGLVALSVALTDIVCYGLLTPQRHPAPVVPGATQPALARAALAIAYGLSVLRLPFAVLPYLGKVCVFYLARDFFYTHWRNNAALQLVRLAGDVLNLGIGIALLRALVAAQPGAWPYALAWLCIAAESIRLIAEKGQMLASAGWQHLPHRAAARVLKRHAARLARTPLRAPVQRYCDYYALDDAQRVEHVLRWMQARAAADPGAACRIAYVHALRVVPAAHGLGAGRVRDVARGEVFIHAAWTNDPWLLIGQVMRRGGWLFDPRCLRRPFYYRTEGNPAATRFVVEHAAYSPPYAWYQFGNEIKVARYHICYAALRRLGLEVERPVRADGTYEFDALLAWLERGARPAAQRPLWSDAEVLAELRHARPLPPAEEIARRYVYPVEYVRDRLLEKIRDAQGRGMP